MRTLHILRHAKSSWDDPELADHERPLSRRGVRDAKRIAVHLRELHAEPAVVLCSSSARTRQTLDLIAASLGDAQIQVEDVLYGASADALLKRLADLPDSVLSAMLIGHSPGLEDLVAWMAAPGPLLDRVMAKFPTGALATLALGDRPWGSVHQAGAELVGFTVPRELG
jgi:phosphohistidine phosphatase